MVKKSVEDFGNQLVPTGGWKNHGQTFFSWAISLPKSSMFHLGGNSNKAEIQYFASSPHPLLEQNTGTVEQLLSLNWET